MSFGLVACLLGLVLSFCFATEFSVSGSDRVQWTHPLPCDLFLPCSLALGNSWVPWLTSRITESLQAVPKSSLPTKAVLCPLLLHVTLSSPQRCFPARSTLQAISESVETQPLPRLALVVLTVGSLLTVAIINMVSYGAGTAGANRAVSKDIISWGKGITFDLGNPDSRIPGLFPEQLPHSSAVICEVPRAGFGLLTGQGRS